MIEISSNKGLKEIIPNNETTNQKFSLTIVEPLFCSIIISISNDVYSFLIWDDLTQSFFST